MKGILVLTKTLGDVILGNVLVKNIKLSYPDIELDYVVEKRYSSLIKFNPDIKECIEVGKTEMAWDEILKMVAFGYDEVFFPQQVCVEDNVWHQEDRYRFQHLVDFYANRCDIKLKDRKLKIYFENEEVEHLEGKKKVICHTTTLGKAKNWTKFEELGKVLRDLGFTVYQIGLGTDVSMKLEEKYDLRDKFSLLKLLSLLSKECDCFVGLDSGVSYMSAAIGKPTICILGASVPQTSGPYGENVKYLFSKTRGECEAKRCHSLYNECKFKSPCIDNISVGEVFEAVSEEFGAKSKV